MALELRRTLTTIVNGKAVPSQCDQYSLYMQLITVPIAGWPCAVVEGTRAGYCRQHGARSHDYSREEA